jgi:hypothetical protein
MAVELSLFVLGVALYVRGGGAGARRVAFWLLMAFLLVAYLGAAFDPVPPDVRTVAVSALALWVLVPIGWWVDRPGAPPRA